MNFLIYIAFILLPFLGHAQAHIGLRLEDLKKEYPDKTFTIEYTNDHQMYTTAEMDLGLFVYYLDKETKLVSYCLQIPYDLVALNTQVERYNKKYVILSETSWKAYLEGGILDIVLIYNEELKKYIFYYNYKL